MNYEIQIHDMQNESDPLIAQFASRDSISMQYEGGEDPDKVIDGSAVQFDMETLFGEDFKYGQYFTSDEKRYRVTWVIEATQEIIWRGYMLPETYSEPYDDPLFYTEFEAVCGLGLLKGKQLEDRFYRDEVSVLEVISACLKLTKVDFDIWMTPAINNIVQENWNTIIIDMLKYEDEDKRPSAYEILDDLLFSKLCKVYQCEGRWYIEGFNRRNLPKNKFFKYTIDGEFLGTQVLERNIKELKYFVDGPATVSMVPALGRLTVSHESPQVEFPKAAYKDDDIEWVPPKATERSFYPREWFIHGEWKSPNGTPNLPVMRSEEYYLDINWITFSGFRPQNYIELLRKPYILKGTRLQIFIKLQFRNGRSLPDSELSKENYDRGNYKDALIYRVSLNNKVLYSTIPGDSFEPQPVNLDEQGRGQLQLDFLTAESGYLNIEFWESFSDDIYAFVSPSLFVEELTVKNLLQRENDVINMVIDENSSVTKDIELPFSDDISAASQSFMLEPIRDRAEDKVRLFTVPILYGFTLNGNNYAIVDLKGAVLMNEFAGEVLWGVYLEDRVENYEVIFNLNGTPEMAIKTEKLYTDREFYVYNRAFAEPTTNRLDWLKWTDSVYGVEEKPYMEVVAEIYKRLFQVPRLKLTGTAEMPFKYNDLIKFKYNGEDRYFAFSNLEWRPSGGNGVSVFTAFEAFYEGVSVGNIPPYVYAGPDLVLQASEDTVQITEAVVNDPDSGSVELIWEQISGPTVAVFSNPNALNPGISNLTGDEYEFQLTGTDEVGNSASDLMKIIRPETYELQFENTANYGSGTWRYSDYALSFDPVLEAGTALLMNFRVQVDIDAHKGSVLAFETWIKKNGNRLHASGHLGELSGTQNFTETGSIQVESGSVLTMQHNISLSNNFKGTVSMKLSFTSFEFLYGSSAAIQTPYPEIIKEIDQ